jgi:2,3-bisphosphoglycerate-dependent phosphoglycerate mutase
MNNTTPTIQNLILLRDGEGAWGADNKIIGWTDIELSNKGIIEAKNSSHKLKLFEFDIVHTSYLKRSIKTWNIIAEETNQHFVPVHKSWRLNERHFGILQGLGHKECIKKYGEEEYNNWKKSYNNSPPDLEYSDPRQARKEEKYKLIPRELIPTSEVRFYLI